MILNILDILWPRYRVRWFEQSPEMKAVVGGKRYYRNEIMVTQDLQQLMYSFRFILLARVRAEREDMWKTGRTETDTIGRRDQVVEGTLPSFLR